jgi:hypothetical protein
MDAGRPELLALAALILTGCGVMTVRAARRGDRRQASRWSTGAAGVVALYAGVLVLVSAIARPVTLAPGEAKRFCGFYLDCPIGVAVVSDRPAPSTEGGLVRHIVTVEMRSDARRATIGLAGMRAALVASDGRRFEAAPADVAGLEKPVPPGGSYRRELVFDVPRDAGPLVLDVRTGWWVDRLIERAIIGDEDSLLHPRVVLALGSTASSGMSRRLPCRGRQRKLL